MRIGQEKEPLLGEFNGIPIADAEIVKEKEKMIMSAENFDILAGIINGFLDYGRGEIPDVPEAVNRLLNSKATEIRYIDTTALGFYRYKIKYGKKEIEFAIEPNLIPIYNYCINDMMRRHRRTPHESFVATEASELFSPLSTIDQAIAKIAEMKKEKKSNESN